MMFYCMQTYEYVVCTRVLYCTNNIEIHISVKERYVNKTNVVIRLPMNSLSNLVGAYHLVRIHSTV